MNRITSLNQAEYHQQRFNPKLLPDLVNAGPVSATILAEAADPLKFLKGIRKKATDDMQWGSAVDMLWLTPEDWDKHYCNLPADAPRKPSVAQRGAKKPSQATIDSIAWWDNWERNSIGKINVNDDMMANVRIARDMLDSHPMARFIWNCSQKQVVLQGDLPGNCLVEGAKAKCMMDLLPMSGEIEVDGKTIRLADCIVDLKQCHNVSEYGMKKAIRQFQYHMKTAWYRRLTAAWEGRIRPHTLLIFQNSYSPHDVHIRMISEEDNKDGAMICQERLNLLSHLDHRDTRNLIDTEIKTLTLNDWMKE